MASAMNVARKPFASRIAVHSRIGVSLHPLGIARAAAANLPIIGERYVEDRFHCGLKLSQAERWRARSFGP